MKSEESVRWMLDQINEIPINNANAFTISAIQVTLKIILGLDPDEDISFMEELE